MCKTLSSRVVPELIAGSREKAENEHQTEEDNYKRHIGAQAGKQKAQSNESHHSIVVSLPSVVRLAESAGDFAASIAGDDADGGIVDVAEIDPVTAVDHEDGHWECVAENKLEDACNIHCDAAEKPEGAGERCKGVCARALEVEKGEYDA